MILPVGGTYTMTDKEAAELVNLTKPDIAIPIHYGDIVGSKQNAENFSKSVQPSTKVVVLL
jgi:L-ascorbate metabolism protein UlaG (beta-lactamase superfamily)